MKGENVQRLVEIVAASLYCAFLAQELLHEDGMLYARFMKMVITTSRTVARVAGYVGIQAELEYGRAVDRERMN
jgi:hypothetical protein